MMSLSTIRQMQAEAAESAAAEGKTPFVTWPEDLARIRVEGRFPFPFLGDYVPQGWTLQETYFVDATGMGLESEPALTVDQFLRVLEEFVGQGWAITEAGQFQVYVGRFTRDEPVFTHPAWEAR